MEFKFSEVLDNPHFNQFVALLRRAMSQHWRQRHPEVPSVRATLDYRLMKLAHDISKSPIIKQDFLEEWVKLFASLIEADPRLYYRQEDMDWFLDVLDGEYATVTMSMLFAAASSRTEFVTPTQVAEATNTAESTWRNKSARGDFIGAWKVNSHQWLIPVASLRAYGVTVDLSGQALDEEMEEEPE